MSKQQLRCAIYTRKSSEEGLNQEFNSLDAQREACAAFIASQIGLGWKLVTDRYDDGGISGGTMERPALQRLLQDIRDRKIDVLVVYKIDRLTRSLMDFSRIVEIFDDSSVSFVSVTQQFNTTTSMGRLTLNVLLSFAQFEREVTAERIRDKIAASKKKGMWMGGTVPLGYAVQQRKLIIKQPEAGFVRGLFERYVQLRSVPALVAEVNRQADSVAQTQDDCAVPFTRQMHAGMVYKMLANPLYIGKLRHHDNVHDGEHEAIVDNDLFDKVQELMALGAVRAKGSSVRPDTHLLSGIVFDETGDRLRPTHATNHGKRYRYYISSRLLPKDRRDEGGWRVPASELENVVRSFTKRLLSDQIKLSDWIAADTSPDMVPTGLSGASQIVDRLASCQTNVQAKAILHVLFKRITLSATEIRFDIDRAALVRMLIEGSDHAELAEANSTDLCAAAMETICVPIALKRRGVEARLILDPENARAQQPAAPLVSLIAKAHLYLGMLTERAGITLVEIAEHFRVHPAEISRLLPLAFLSPQLTNEILTGLQPTELSARSLSRMDLSTDWSEQAAQLRS
ncbi:recombinase family protein [Aminobacter sp. Piv2-1]|uniref:recombinase family protein n=1 Tax=Aminobacter sp. Piv2-1 TaxID=3031122 RepID=UPI0030AA876F